ncbi:7856_t:CDS:2 [Funneliformis geosporum]|nr:7856_t:CDS:2 [Funneliformis geosporum]
MVLELKLTGSMLLPKGSLKVDLNILSAKLPPQPKTLTLKLRKILNREKEGSKVPIVLISNLAFIMPLLPNSQR